MSQIIMLVSNMCRNFGKFIYSLPVF